MNIQKTTFRSFKKLGEEVLDVKKTMYSSNVKKTDMQSCEQCKISTLQIMMDFFIHFLLSPKYEVIRVEILYYVGRVLFHIITYV
jgi:hypothetical protein